MYVDVGRLFYLQGHPNIVRECLETKWNESLQFLLFSLFGLSSHETEELCELDQPSAVIIELVDQVLQFILCGVFSQGFHHASQL